MTRFFRDLPDLHWLFIWVIKYYPWLTPGAISPDVIARGLGTRGCVPIPAHVWNSLVPAHLMTSLRSSDLSSHPWVRAPGPDAARMLRTLMSQGFLQADPSCRANTSVFLRPKSTEKCCFIADMRAVNEVTPRPLPPMSLPSLELLGDCLTREGRASLWGTTLDLTNFYWSLRLPPSARGAFRVHGGF